MIRIGITGGIGSGKSTVCRLFGLLGIPVYDSDRRARQLMNEESALKENIAALLGQEAYRNGSLDRAWVASRVFGDETLLAQLNGLVHPAVGSDFLRWADRIGSGGEDFPNSDFPFVSQGCAVPYVILESAILMESGLAGYVECVVAVLAPEALRINRTAVRSGLNEAAIRERMAQQLTDEARAAQADYVITNDGRSALIEQVLPLHTRFSAMTERD